MTGVTLIDASRGDRAQAPPQEPPRFPKPIGLTDFLALQIPPRELLLAPWLPAKGLAMIAAPRGIGKTFVALNVAYAVASGGSFLRWQAPCARRVLYIDGEMPARALQDRVRAIADKAQIKPLAGSLAIMAADMSEDGVPDISTPEAQAALMPMLAPYDLVVLDNLSTLCRSGRENEAESWTTVQGFALALRRAGKSALFVHHTGKNGAQRGTSRREDVLDTVILLKRPEDYDAKQGARFICAFDKARGFTGDAADSFEAALDPYSGEWTVKAVTASRDAEIREMKEMGFSMREIAKELGVAPSTVHRTIHRPNGSVGHE